MDSRPSIASIQPPNLPLLPRRRMPLLMGLIFCAMSNFASGEVVKDFTIPSATDSSLIRLSDFSGKVILINWWRTSCQWSQRESPRLVQLYDKYRDKGLVIIGVSDDTADTVAQIPAYLKHFGIRWPVGLNDQGEFMRDIRPLGRGDTPGNYLVTRSGEIKYLGLDRKPEDWQHLEEVVAAAIGKPAAPNARIAPRVPAPAPTFELRDLQGKTVRFSDFSGKPILVNFFNSQSCDWAGAVVSDVSRKYAQRGLQVVGISLFDSDAVIQACKSKHGATYPILRGTEAVQRAWIGDSKAWATFFITADGKIVKAIRDSIENGLEAILFPKYAEYLISRR